MRLLPLVLVLPALLPAAELSLKTMTAQMKYDTTEFTVTPGQPVTIQFENGDDLPHNFVLCKPGTDVVALSMKQMTDPESVKRNWLPNDPAVIAHSKMLNPHEREKITFTMPEKPGIYPFVCTFPGHAMTMKGQLKSFPPGPGLKDLSFKLYLGSWKQLPDFSKLTPHREGSIPDNLIQLKLDDYKNEFGVVYTAKLTAPKKGNYRFSITGDDGVRLLIDGKQVAEFDGIHPAGTIKEGSVQLEQGDHDFRLEYFQAAGQAEVFAAWKGANFAITALSKWKPDDWEQGSKGGKKNDFAPILLVVKDEPVLYRNFIADAGNRAIAVGYPGGVNIAWSAESMNLALVWRGAFMDAGRHWNSRGGGHQPPLGFDVVKPVGPVVAATDRKWLGYKLDAHSYPTFRYQWGDATVTDTFRSDGGKLFRTFNVSGALPAGAEIPLASGTTITPNGATYTIAAAPTPIRITSNAATLTKDGLRLLLQSGTTTLTYEWVK